MNLCIRMYTPTALSATTGIGGVWDILNVLSATLLASFGDWWDGTKFWILIVIWGSLRQTWWLFDRAGVDGRILYQAGIEFWKVLGWCSRLSNELRSFGLSKMLDYSDIFPSDLFAVQAHIEELGGLPKAGLVLHYFVFCVCAGSTEYVSTGSFWKCVFRWWPDTAPTCIVCVQLNAPRRRHA